MRGLYFIDACFGAILISLALTMCSPATAPQSIVARGQAPARGPWLCEPHEITCDEPYPPPADPAARAQRRALLWPAGDPNGSGQIGVDQFRSDQQGIIQRGCPPNCTPQPPPTPPPQPPPVTPPTTPDNPAPAIYVVTVSGSSLTVTTPTPGITAIECVVWTKAGTANAPSGSSVTASATNGNIHLDCHAVMPCPRGQRCS